MHPLLLVAITLLCSVMIILVLIAVARSLSRDYKAFGRLVQGSRHSFASEQQKLEELSRLVEHIKQQGEEEN